MMMIHDADDVLLPARRVRERLGNRSDMWLWRQLKFDPQFPRPLIINGRRYWWLSALRSYEQSKTSPSR
jgi:predicted DNA-binding transcriptional regulator AlpA